MRLIAQVKKSKIVIKINFLILNREEQNSFEREDEPVMEDEDKKDEVGGSKLSNSNLIQKPEETPVIKKPSKIKMKLRSILDYWMTQTFMTTLTVYILFADDVKMLCTDSGADNIFSGICVGVMFIFSVEFVISSFVVEDYFLGFYFWLDLVSVLSMILDVHWFYNLMINLVSGADTTTTVVAGSGGSNVKSVSAIAKAGRGAKVGSRAIRILRILRIIRLVRISKLYKASEKLIEEKVNREMKKLKKKQTEEQNAINYQNRSKSNLELDEQGNKEVIPQESKVGKKLSDLTTRRVIILVLAMMIGIILFNSSFYYSTVTSMDFGIKIFNDFDNYSDPNFNLTFDIYVSEHMNISSPIIFAQVGYLSFGDFNSTLVLREAEKIIASEDCDSLIPQDPDYSICTAIFDNRSNSQLASILNIIKTIFICIVLSCGAIFFSKDTSEMVLEPIESMIHKIKEISKNPIEAMQNNEKEEFAKSLLEQEEKTNNNIFTCFSCSKRDEKKKRKKDAPLETVLLENTISKIGALLALGFGEAGSEIIAKNMQNNVNGDVNPLLPGKKVMAIYGFCDIRNFTDTTEVLQEKVMIFVNEIAEIVHEITAEHCGSANKNIGDAFLLVWKFEDQYVEINNGEINLIYNKSVNQICDMALVSFIRILAKVHKSYKLDKYRKNQGLNDRIKNYSVKMGFGLHLGWSIEGAIGSTFKIDASYLSPHVNTASHLEEKTKEYGVQLVISGDFIKYCSDDLRRRVRIIDETVGENDEKESVYTMDIDTNALKIEDSDPDVEEHNDQHINNSNEKKVNAMSSRNLDKYKKRMKRKMNYEDAINGVREIWKEFEDNDEDYTIMRKKYKQEFYDYYNQGFQYYQIGEWMKAKASFEKAQEVLGDKDGPTENLMHIMKKDNFVRPVDWKVTREAGGH